jgi:hypothetical protein
MGGNHSVSAFAAHGCADHGIDDHGHPGRDLEVQPAAGLKRFQAKWAPIRVKKTRQNKN